MEKGCGGGVYYELERGYEEVGVGLWDEVVKDPQLEAQATQRVETGRKKPSWVHLIMKESGSSMASSQTLKPGIDYPESESSSWETRRCWKEWVSCLESVVNQMGCVLERQSYPMAFHTPDKEDLWNEREYMVAVVDAVVVVVGVESDWKPGCGIDEAEWEW